MPIEGSARPPTKVGDIVGTLVGGRYRVLSLIGRGGMASVYRAEDQELPRTVAIKLMPAGSSDSDEVLRQRNEVDTLASLNHPGLVTLLDAGLETSPDGDRAFLVMEFVNGPNLRKALHAPFATDQVAHIGADIAEALHYMHAKGVIHRDVKPANILLAPSDLPGRRYHAKLADFGIARLLDAGRLTSTGVIIGTVNYLSPEQARGKAVGPETDVYSLGLVLLEARTGKKVYSGTAIETVSARLSSEPAIPVTLGEGWQELLRGMTALDPASRPRPLEIALALRDLGGVPLPADTGLARAGTGAVPATLPVTSPPPPPPGTVPEHEGTGTRAARNTAPTRTIRSDPPPAAINEPNRLSQRGRTRLIAIVSAAVLALGAAVGALAWSTAPGPQPASPSYPAVSGTLGSHLKELQKNVIP